VQTTRDDFLSVCPAGVRRQAPMCRHSRKSGDYWIARCAQRLATVATQLVRLLLDSRFLVEIVYFRILKHAQDEMEHRLSTDRSFQSLLRWVAMHSKAEERTITMIDTELRCYTWNTITRPHNLYTPVSSYDKTCFFFF
jgi:hypothetical protein